MSYNPLDWYWIVNDSMTHVYSSRTGNYVPIDDPAYAAFAKGGDIATRITSEADLGEVLAPYSLRPAASGVLDGYQDRQSRELTIQIVAKVLLWLVNEVRTLEGQPTINAGQFRTFLKGLM